jgi:hypothetical protein
MKYIREITQKIKNEKKKKSTKKCRARDKEKSVSRDPLNLRKQIRKAKLILSQSSKL